MLNEGKECLPSILHNALNAFKLKYYIDVSMTQLWAVVCQFGKVALLMKERLLKTILLLHKTDLTKQPIALFNEIGPGMSDLCKRYTEFMCRSECFSIQ